MTFTDFIRKKTNRLVEPLGHWFNSIGIHPNTLTFIGLLFVVFAAYPLAVGYFFTAGVILLAGLSIDALDGATARAYGKFRPFGAFLDSTLDRYSDAIIFGSLIYYFVDHGNPEMMGVGLVAIHGALTVSYTRARAEGLNIECKVGWLSRLERIIILLVALFATIFDLRAINVGVIVLAVGSEITALQRIFHVYKNTKSL